jgi:hypothetical protein
VCMSRVMGVGGGRGGAGCRASVVGGWQTLQDICGYRTAAVAGLRWLQG